MILATEGELCQLPHIINNEWENKFLADSKILLSTLDMCFGLTTMLKEFISKNDTFATFYLPHYELSQLWL